MLNAHPPPRLFTAKIQQFRIKLMCVTLLVSSVACLRPATASAPNPQKDCRPSARRLDPQKGIMSARIPPDDDAGRRHEPILLVTAISLQSVVIVLGPEGST